MKPLTPSDIKRWDLDAIRAVFETAGRRANTLQRLGDDLHQVGDVLADWHGDAGEAFRADLGKVRRDIEADGAESRRVAAAVSCAETDVSGCKVELDDIERAADANGWTITSDWRIDVGDTWIGRDPVEFAAVRQLLQDDLNALKAHAHNADHELATAIRAAVGEVQLDAAGHPPEAPQQTPDSVPGPHAGNPDARSGSTPPTLQDMLLPAGAAGAGPGGALPQGSPNPAGGGADPAGTPPSLQDLLLPTGRAQPSGQAAQQPLPGSLPDLLSRLHQPAVPGAPAPSLKPADVESFKAMARPIMVRDGVPPDQIEDRLDAIVVSTQQWMADGMPAYVPSEPQRPPPPGFAEGFADRWWATEQGIENLIGQGGPGAPGVLESWAGLAKGAVGIVQDPVGAAMGEVKDALDSPSPAYYLGAKASDAATTLPGLLFGGEGAAVRAGLPADLDAATGLPHDLPGGHPPLSAFDHVPTGIGDHHSPLPADHSIPDGSHSYDPYPMDGNDHYLPGSLPSYEQLQGITSTEPNSAYYWSGRNAGGIGIGPDGSGIAELIAHGSGGTTLEMTLAENGLDPLPVWNRHDPASVQFWEEASAAYAENARGEVTAIVGSNLRPGNVWQTIEIPRLIENPNVTRIVEVDPDTGQSITIFERGK